MLIIEFATALVALGLLQPGAVVVVLPALAGIWALTRRMQQPAAHAGHRRQQELETMTSSVARELDRHDDHGALGRFRLAAERVMAAEVRYGWLRAFNLQGSGGLAKLGPIAVVIIAAFLGTKQAETLISVYLLAQRAFWGFDGLIDLSLSMQSVRGGVVRCFELIDTPRELAKQAPNANAVLSELRRPSSGAIRNRSRRQVNSVTAAPRPDPADRPDWPEAPATPQAS